MYKLSAVSYLNTKPFLYGLEHGAIADETEISLDPPAVTAEKLIRDEVDIALIPVAVLPLLKQPKIISPFCIGSNGKVATVCLFSDVPLEEIETILLDYQSKTSVQLVQILCREFWKKDVFFARAYPDYESDIYGKTAGVVIGDRTIALMDKFDYVYDLSEEWKKFCGLPFVFAVWASQHTIDNSYTKKLNAALDTGLQHIYKIIDNYAHLNTPSFQVAYYLRHNLSFELNAEKIKALKLFMGYMCANDRCAVPDIQFDYSI